MMPGKARRLLLRLTVGTAKRTRKCSHDKKKHPIPPDDVLLLVHDAGVSSGSPTAAHAHPT